MLERLTRMVINSYEIGLGGPILPDSEQRPGAAWSAKQMFKRSGFAYRAATAARLVALFEYKRTTKPLT